jgi:hypothetical protein
LGPVCGEILRIADAQFNLLEGHEKGGLIYKQFLEESESEDEGSEPETTVCPPQLAEILTDPLPELPRSLDYEEEDSSEIGSSMPGQRACDGQLGDTERIVRGWKW